MIIEPIHTTSKVTDRHKEAVCPCCRQEATFTHAGEQRWPRRVAQQAGMPELIQLWTCQNCQSTVSEIDLLFQ